MDPRVSLMYSDELLLPMGSQMNLLLMEALSFSLILPGHFCLIGVSTIGSVHWFFLMATVEQK